MQKAAGARVVVRGDEALASSVLRKTRGVASVENAATETRLAPSPGTVVLSVVYETAADGPETTERVVADLVGAGLFVREVSPLAASLEQVFSELTRRDEPSGKGAHA